MRRVIWILIFAALLWCAWWALAAFGLHSGVTNWFADRREEGWQAELADVTSSGFPARIETTLVAPDLADPATGLSVSLEDLTLTARTLWPGDMAVLFPASPIRVATPQGKWTVLADNARADLNLHPGTSLELEALSLTSGAFRLGGNADASLLGGAALTLSLTQTDTPDRYTLRFDITDFTPGDAPRAALALPSDWPLIFDVLTADADVTFDAPLDRRTLEHSRPQPDHIDLHRVEAHWGDMRFLATGEMRADTDRRAVGSLTIKAENWQQMLDLATASGLLPDQFRPQAESVLTTLAAGTGRTDDIDVTLRFENGLTRLGFLPLGPAPKMVLR